VLLFVIVISGCYNIKVVTFSKASMSSPYNIGVVDKYPWTKLDRVTYQKQNMHSENYEEEPRRVPEGQTISRHCCYKMKV